MRYCYVSDIDGTIADEKHRLHHIVGPCPHCLDIPGPNPGCDKCSGTGQKEKDWPAFYMACGGDAPHRHVIRVLRCLHRAGHAVVLGTGREEMCRELTVDWLHRHAVPHDALYMRAAGETGDGEKLLMLAKMRADGWQPVMLFEDRQKVVDAWRSVGIPVAQVAAGDF